MKARQKSKAAGNINQLRIIGGRWRGRKLNFPDADGLRPTGDRIRETLFNWLAPVVTGAHCLDLFAGSGALGFEALSRGAASATLIEKDFNAARLLKQHQQILAAKGAAIINTDALSWLQNIPAAGATYDIVFIDPPFQAPLVEPACEQLEATGLLSVGAMIYIETDIRATTPNTPAEWQLERENTAGQVCYRLYRRN